MFYESALIKSLENCAMCKGNYVLSHSPVTLTCCGAVICYLCNNSIILTAINNKYNCIVCSNENELPINGFPKSELANRILLAAKDSKRISRGPAADNLILNHISLRGKIADLNASLNSGHRIINIECSKQEETVNASRILRLNQIESQFDNLSAFVESYHENLIEINIENLIDQPQTRIFELLTEVESTIKEQKQYLNQKSIDPAITLTFHQKLLDLNSLITLKKDELEKFFKKDLLSFNSIFDAYECIAPFGSLIFTKYNYQVFFDKILNDISRYQYLLLIILFN
jgi:hypothetical protein